MRRQDGFALPLALCALVTIGLLVAAVSFYASRNVTASARSVSDRKAHALADAGLNAALSVLESAPDPTVPTSVPAVVDRALDGGAYSYTATLNGMTWTLVGTGRYPAQTQGSLRPLVRTTRLDVNVVHQPILDIWQYLYSDATGACSTRLRPNAEVSSPLYVNGDLCVDNNSHVHGSPLQVDGNLTIDNNGSVGEVDAPLNQVGVGGQCMHGGAHTCTYSDYNLFTRNLIHGTGTLSKPPLQLDDWYQNANLGPMHGCATGAIPGGFDGDTIRNGSRATFDLTPSGYDYDCRSADGAGRLTWVRGAAGEPGTLTVSGVVYFDGDVQMGVNETATYQGRASIYATGTIVLDNNTKLCGVAACDGTWDPNANLLVLVAGSPASPALSIMQNAIYQGGAYVNGDYYVENNATNWGPVIANHLTIVNNAGQTVPLNSLPPGAPAYYTTSLQVAPASYR